MSNDITSNDPFLLESQVVALTELLTVEEQVVTEQSAKLEETITALRSEIARRKTMEEQLQKYLEDLKAAKEAHEENAAKLGETVTAMEIARQEADEANQKLKQSQIQLLQSEKMASIGQLAAGVAHEINNPMGFIISNLNSLQKYVNKIVSFIETMPQVAEKVAGDHSSLCCAFMEQLTKQKQEMNLDYILSDLNDLVKESLEGADRVKKIVQNLKSFSHIDESELKMADINAGLENTINIIWNELKYKATVTKSYGDIPQTLCNPGQLNQVFMNILINAVQAIPKQGEITIKTWRENSHIYVAISDTGIGIPADRIDRIFEPFYTTKEVGKGTGLGLSIVYDIIKKHNAEIQVTSEINKGTIFTVIIPIAQVHN